LGTALDFIHSLHLVHRDIKLENVLVFRSNLSQIKLCDFGYTRAEGALVTKTNQTWIPFSPPEICQIVHKRSITVIPRRMFGNSGFCSTSVSRALPHGKWRISQIPSTVTIRNGIGGGA
jgi:serine/threonine protein kinase